MAPTWAVPGLFSFFSDKRSDIFYKLYKLASTNCHSNESSSASDFLRFAKQKDVGSSPALDPNIFCAGYFGFGRLFSRKFFKCLQRIPSFFSILQKNRCSKTLIGPPFTFLGTMRLNSDKKIRNFLLMRVL